MGEKVVKYRHSYSIIDLINMRWHSRPSEDTHDLDFGQNKIDLTPFDSSLPLGHESSQFFLPDDSPTNSKLLLFGRSPVLPQSGSDRFV